MVQQVRKVLKEIRDPKELKDHRDCKAPQVRRGLKEYKDYKVTMVSPARRDHRV